jgi:hypothetical protein
MPQGVCIFCVNKLDESEKLLKKAHDADTQFRHVLVQKNVITFQDQQTQIKLVRNLSNQEESCTFTVTFVVPITLSKSPFLIQLSF